MSDVPFNKTKMDFIYLLKTVSEKNALLKCVNGLGISNVGTVKMNPSTQYVNKQHEHNNMKLRRHLLPSSYNIVTKKYFIYVNNKKLD